MLATPGYTPPQANFDGETEGMIPSSLIAPPKKGKKGKAAGEITKLYFLYVLFIGVSPSLFVCV